MKKFILSVMLLLGSGMFVHAEDAMDLGRIVVTPYRYGDVMGKASAGVTVVTWKDIERSGVSRVSDVLKTVPGIMVRDLYGNGAKVAVDMAGFGEQAALNTLVLVDGRKVNNMDLSGTDWSLVPLEQIERIEIVRGASGAVLYGDNASAGVINIITRRGSGAPKMEAETLYGSYQRNAQKFSGAGGMDNMFSWRFSAGRDVTQGWRQNAFVRNHDIGGALAYDPTEVVSMKLAAGLHRSSYGLPGALYQDNIDRYGRDHARFVNDNANNKDYYFAWGLERDLVSAGRIGFDLHYRKNETRSWFPSSTNPTLKNNVRTFGISPKYTFEEMLLGRENRLVIGIDRSRTIFNSDSHDRSSDAMKSYTNIHKDTLAVYAHDALDLTDTLSMNAGWRREAARYDFGYHDYTTPPWNSPDRDTSLHPKMEALSLGAVKTYAPGSNVFANVSRSYRFPQVDEFTYTDDSWKQQLKADLQPQSSLSVEGGVRHSFSDVLKAEVSAFRMRVKDEIFYNAKYAYIFDGWSWDWTGRNDNYDRTIHQGAAASLEWELSERLSSTAGYTFTDARFDGGVYHGNEVPMVARHKASAGLKFMMLKELALGVSGNYVGARYFYNDQANAYSRLNGYFTADALVSWEHKDVTMTLNVNNIFDKKYADQAGVRVNEDGVYGYHAGDKFYYPAPGRNFTAGVKYKF